jgi:pimeloyl-ACP methyl ester carboxylesterase
MTSPSERPPGDGPRYPRPPPLNSLLFWLDPARATWEFTVLLALAPWLRRAPRGDGHPVLVLPGLLADDAAMVACGAFLRDRGYAVHGWGEGRNLGRWDVIESLEERLASLRSRHGRAVSVVGWSMGGLYARELARRRPECVRCLVQLGTPFAGQPRTNPNWWLYELTSRLPVEATQLGGRMAERPPVPTTSIWSRTDGHVDWRNCVERTDDASASPAENVAVQSSHHGLPHHPVALWVVADRLAQPEGEWSPYAGPTDWPGTA